MRLSPVTDDPAEKQLVTAVLLKICWQLDCLCLIVMGSHNSFVERPKYTYRYNQAWNMYELLESGIE